MLVYAEQRAPRLNYVVRHVIERMLGWSLTWTDDVEEFRKATGPKFAYGNVDFDGVLRIPRTGKLEQIGSKKESVSATGSGSDFRIFPGGDGHDLFASIFYLLSLTDEIDNTERDSHGRVIASALLVVRHKVDHLPIIDHWVRQLARDLRARYPELPAPTRSFKHVLTVDVDNGLKYAGRPLHRALGASAKDMLRHGPSAVPERWKVRSGAEPDPYAILPERLANVRDRVDRMIAFFLIRGNGEYDHAADVGHPAFRALIKATAEEAEVGLHPSYATSREAAMGRRELDELTEVLGKLIKASRQHFLRWQLPSSLREKVGSGITEDHTLGFSDRVGFRVGTCTPFPWYDVEREEETTLMLWPFAAMDSAVHEQMGVPVVEAAARFIAMMDAVKAVDGTFVSVWHDRYLSGHDHFAGWPEVMEQVVDAARK